MPKSLSTSAGALIQIGRELGAGGEGSVYEVSGVADQVAKLYHTQPDRAKQAKLAFMAAHGDARADQDADHRVGLLLVESALHPHRDRLADVIANPDLIRRTVGRADGGVQSTTEAIERVGITSAVTSGASGGGPSPISSAVSRQAMR